MASIQTINFSQYQWEVNDQNYLTKWNNFQSAIDTLQENINQFGAESSAEVNNAIGIAQSLIEAYEVNVLEPYRQKATLDLNFARGLYRVDDGSLQQTADASSILVVPRATPKIVAGSDGLLAESEAGAIARTWEGGLPQGVVTSSVLTNKVLQSNLLASSEWYSQNVTPSASDVIFSRDDRALNKITQNTGTGTHLVQQVFAEGYEGYWVSFLAKSGEMTKLRCTTTTSASQTVTIDLVNGVVAAQGGGLSYVSVTPLQNGIYRVLFKSNNVGRVLFYPENSNGDINYTGDGVSSLYIGAVSVSQRRPLEYVESGASEVSSQNDFPTLGLHDNRFNPYEFTWYFEYRNYNTSDQIFSICGSSHHNSFNILAVYTAGATPRFDIRSLTGGDWIPISGYNVDEEYGKKQRIVVTYSQKERVAKLFWKGELRVAQSEVGNFLPIGDLIFGSRRLSVEGYTSETIFSEFLGLAYAITDAEAEELTAL